MRKEQKYYFVVGRRHVATEVVFADTDSYKVWFNKADDKIYFQQLSEDLSDVDKDKIVKAIYEAEKYRAHYHKELALSIALKEV